MNTLGERLREVMQELKIESPKDLAKFCGVSEGLVSQWFSGQTKLGPKPLLAFSKTQFNLDWLLHGKLPKYADAKFVSDENGNLHIFGKNQRNAEKHEGPADSPSEDEFTLIPQLDVRASCGAGGKFHDHVVVKGGLAFKRSFLQEMSVNEDHARIIYADGPSMEPTIGHGRVVLVNTADNAPKDGKVYLICDEDGGMILKRLVREYEPSAGATVWKIRSDNPDKRKYPDKFWPEDARACIVGRAIWHDGLL